jgi:spore coat polysaccharide biosynthesis predicted glycosyltransferase SpsG
VIELSLNISIKNKKILILTHTNKKIGSGNYIRSKNLCLYLKKKNINIDLIVNKKENEIINLISKLNYNLIIVDTNQFKISFLKLLINRFIVICFDNLQKIKPHYNILIHEHVKTYVQNKKFIGIKYINLRKQITDNKLKKKAKNLKKEVLICLGSGDIRNQGIKITKYMLKKGFFVTLIRGNYNVSLDSYRHKNLIIKRNIKNIQDYFKKFNFVITNGGTTLFENLHYRNQVYVLPQTKHEYVLGNFFQKNNQILGMGFINFYKFNIEKYPDFYVKKNNIDGMGVNRIIKIIEKILINE